MGARKCSITQCRSVSGRQEHRGVTFHSFPNHPLSRALWIENCQLPETKAITKSIFICSRHFRRADFQPLKNDKYLLRQGAVPTIFPWGTKPAMPLLNTNPAALRTISEDLFKVATAGVIGNSTNEIATTSANIDGNVDLSNVASMKNDTIEVLSAINPDLKTSTAIKRSASADNSNPKPRGRRPKIPRKSLDVSAKKLQLPVPKSKISFDPVSLFLPGSRIEAQDFKEIWHTAKVVEVDHNEREVLIHFENENKGQSVGIADEWISMNSSRLRPIQKLEQQPSASQQEQQQKISLKKTIPVYSVGERVHAKWTDSRKFPATVQKILDNNMYEVLFDDGYMKIVKAIAMSRVKGGTISSTVTTTPTSEPTNPNTTPLINPEPLQPPPPQKSSTSTGSGGRKSQPPLPIPKFDLTQFDLLPIPKDGEWCCNWVNDVPIGEEGFLEGPDGNRRPTVLVEDWRLPAGWTKHLYQRSSVSGKWDVVLVGPSKKRFRSKADVKVYLEENGEQYNPDVYDFSIHKRRSKDMNLYFMTEDYKIELKKKLAAQTAAAAAAKAAQDQHLDTKSVSELLPKDSKVLSILSETTAAVAAAVASPSQPPSTLLSADINATSITDIGDISTEDMFTGFPPPTEQPLFNSVISESSSVVATPTTKQRQSPIIAVASTPPPLPVVVSSSSLPSTSQQQLPPPLPQLDLGFVYVGALKVEIVDNLFRCPDLFCNKSFRKENHLQIHVKHYHVDMAKLLGVCPNMTDLACLRTTGGHQTSDDVQPKNQMSNAQFFEKMHQSDLQMKQIRSPKSAMTSPSSIKSETSAPATAPKSQSTPKIVDDVVTQKIEPTITPNETIKKEEIADTNKLLTTTTTERKQTNDEILQQKLSELAAAEIKSEAAESSFETTFLLQDCIGGYPDPIVHHSSNKRTANKECEKYQMDVEGLIETHAVGRSTTNKRGAGRKKGAGRSKANLASSRRHPAGKARTASRGHKLKFHSRSKSTIAAASPTTPPASVGASTVPTADSSIAAVSPSSQLFDNTAMDITDPTIDNINSINLPATSSSSLSIPKYINENGEVIKIVRMRQEEIINCLCGYGEEDGLMIQCELCLCWQHGVCNNIEKESQVPDKYVCAICLNPYRGRNNMRYIHDQDWLFDGKLPVANYQLMNGKRSINPKRSERFDQLKQSHSLTGNLLDLKRFMNSLKVKINIAANKDHPKMYLWSKKWENSGSSSSQRLNAATTEIKSETNVDENNGGDKPIELSGGEIKTENKIDGINLTDDNKALIDVKKFDSNDDVKTISNIPQPEAAIDSTECQHRLLEHIQKQQTLAMTRLQSIEARVIALEAMDEKSSLNSNATENSDDFKQTKQTIYMLLNDLEKMEKLAAINKVEVDI